MGISSQEFLQTKAHFLDLDALDSAADGTVTAVAVTIRGIRGSVDEARRGGPQDYRLLIDLSRMARELPAVWIADPPDARIEHVNIFTANEVCPFTSGKLPLLCWGITPAAWRDVERRDRSLSNLLEAAHQVLAGANLQSRAR